MSDLHKKLQINRLPPMPPAGIGGSRGGKRTFGRQRDFTPVTWEKYFQKKHKVEIDSDTFCVYERGSSGPALLLLHGGGFSALTWALLSECITGQVDCRCIGIDLRGHGETVTTNDQDLSAEILSCDIAKVVTKLLGDDPPRIILVGHSMGGAIAVHVCHQQLLPNISGLIVIDVVEGTAMDALISMQSFLRGRPSLFKSLEHAIEWSIKSNQIRNLDSAKVSMVGQLKRCDTNESASEVLSDTAASSNSDTITEEDEGGGGGNNSEQAPFKSPAPHSTNGNSSTRYTWRIDLTKSEPYWRGWFEGLSNKFLSCTPPKMLLLAGVDRLDKDLTVGQMQGKFQMQVFPQCGHAPHEDVPDKVADALCTFMVRHKLAEASDPFNRVFPSC